jgi:serine/threonine protein phosphatase PrpC
MPEPKPLLNQIDVYGLTHKGLVRGTNADHFLVASFHRAILVHAASLAPESLPAFSPDSRGFVLLVADGVGSMAHGVDGSAKVTDTIARYLVEMSEISLLAQPNREAELLERLREPVSAAHLELQAYARDIGTGAATTITACLMVWPCAFIAHAGDSRAYRLRKGRLERLTTDQTMAQVMIDAGTMTREVAEASNLKNVLLSAVGGKEFDLAMSVTDTQLDDRWLLCTDGLTRHVSDEELKTSMASGMASEAMCKALLALALERGGADNVTIIAAQARRPRKAD